MAAVVSSPRSAATGGLRSAPLSIGRQPVRFGTGQRHMIGMYHFPKPAEPAGTAVLLCNPFGQEAIRAQRVYAVLADRLAGQGVPTLRFDYHGTGDSPGDDEDGELEGWSADVRSAQEKLDGLARPSVRVWIGLRLGALLAAMASAACDESPPDSLILWDPVLDGSAYLRELARADREAQLRVFSLDAGRRKRLSREPLPSEPDEALGFPISTTLRGQLRASNGTVFQRPGRARLAFIVSSKEDEDWIERFRRLRSDHAAIATHRIQTRIDWATNDAGGTTIAPAEIVRLIIPAVLGHST